MKEELGVIKDIHVGIRDTNYPICWFTVQLLKGSALQILSFDEIKQILQENAIYKLEDLNNRTCVVENDNYTVKFKRLA